MTRTVGRFRFLLRGPATRALAPLTDAQQVVNYYGDPGASIGALALLRDGEFGITTVDSYQREVVDTHDRAIQLFTRHGKVYTARQHKIFRSATALMAFDGYTPRGAFRHLLPNLSMEDTAALFTFCGYMAKELKRAAPRESDNPFIAIAAPALEESVEFVEDQWMPPPLEEYELPRTQASINMRGRRRNG